MGNAGMVVLLVFSLIVVVLAGAFLVFLSLYADSGGLDRPRWRAAAYAAATLAAIALLGWQIWKRVRF